MSKVMGKCMAGIESVTSKTKTSWSNSKLDGKVIEQEKKISSLTAEIGRLTLLDLDSGTELSPAVMERYAEIVNAREEIAKAEQGKTVTIVVCPHCGAKNAAGMHYCSGCGQNMETRAISS